MVDRCCTQAGSAIGNARNRGTVHAEVMARLDFAGRRHAHGIRAANLQGANFTRANLTGSEWSGTDARNVVFNDAKGIDKAKFTDTNLRGYRGELPYGFGVVEVEDGLCVIARLTEPRLDRLRVGLPVRLVVDTLFTDDDGQAVLDYSFRPEDA